MYKFCLKAKLHVDTLELQSRDRPTGGQVRLWICHDGEERLGNSKLQTIKHVGWTDESEDQRLHLPRGMEVRLKLSKS